MAGNPLDPEAKRKRRKPARRIAGWLTKAWLVGTVVLLLSPGILRTRSGPESQGESTPRPGQAASPWGPSGTEVRRGNALEAPEPASFGENDLGNLGASRLDTHTREGAERPALDATFDCVLEAYEVVDIGSTVVGAIQAIPVERSDLVEAGQVVVELESGAEKAATRVARARVTMDGRIRARQESLSLEQRRRKRGRELFERDAVSLEAREQVETEARLAELELHQAHEDRQLASLELERALEILRRRTIRSPVSGVVIERLMSPGEVVDEETILRIAQIDPLRVQVILPAALIGSVRPGTRAAVEPEFPGDQVHVASVAIVDRVVDAASGTFEVRLDLPNPDHAIPAGLDCRVRFLSD